MDALKKCMLFLGVVMLCAAFAGCAAKPDNPSPDAEEEAIVSFLREYFTLNCQDIAAEEDIGADYSRYWIEEPENKDRYAYFLRDTEAKKWLYSRDGHALTETFVEVTCKSLTLTDDGAAARVYVVFHFYDQKVAATMENYYGSATGLDYDVRLQKRGGAWRIADLDFTDDATQSLKDAALTMEEFRKRSEDSERSAEDAMIAKCTHVIAAKYAGRVPAYCDEELEFIPVEVLKGTVEEPGVHVQAGSAYFQYHKEPEAGEAVILVGNRHTSIYYPHDIYTVGAILKDTPEERERIEEVLRTAPPVERTHYGPEITYSDDMEDILAATGLVFLVEPTAVGDHGVYAPTVLCKCRVLQAYVGQPIYSEINIVFFEDTVAVGNEYLVLVNQIDDGNIYNLSSRNSVYTLEEAMKIEELRALMESAEPVTAPHPPTDEEILAAEAAAAKKVK